MSADPVVTAMDHRDDGDVRCWCCGTTDLAGRMVQLGDHPEVSICLGCAHYVHQQAWEIEDEDNGGPYALLRDGLRNLRALVIRRGWHHHTVMGSRLRWLGKYLP